MASRVTLKDVARAAGVATVTASYALNHTGTISQRTADHVLRVAAELGYRPHIGAASLRRQHSLTIGVLIPTLHNPFYSELVEALETASRSHGFSILGGATNHDPALEKHYTDLFLGRRCDGLIVITDMGRTDDLLHAGTPTVLLNTHLRREFDQVPLVEVDEVQGMRTAILHLAGLGHERIAFVGYAPAPPRMTGYRLALEAAGIAYDADLVVLVDDIDHPQAAHGPTQRLLRQRPDITAVMAVNDMVALGVVRAAYLAGRRVPDDLAVVGFDNISLAAELVPNLTTVAQPIDAIAASAIELMMEQIRGDSDDSTNRRHVLLSPQLIVRESCGASFRANGADGQIRYMSASGLPD